MRTTIRLRLVAALLGGLPAAGAAAQTPAVVTLHNFQGYPN
jgi:hypothetical protein